MLFEYSSVLYQFCFKVLAKLNLHELVIVFIISPEHKCSENYCHNPKIVVVVGIIVCYLDKNFYLTLLIHQWTVAIYIWFPPVNYVVFWQLFLSFYLHIGIYPGFFSSGFGMLIIFFRPSGRSLFQGGANKYRYDDLTETVSCFLSQLVNLRIRHRPDFECNYVH